MKYVVGIFFLVFAIFNARRTLQEVRDGEAHLVVSAGGDGLFGRAEKSDQPIAFWFNVVVHALVVMAAAVGGLWLLFGSADF